MKDWDREESLRRHGVTPTERRAIKQAEKQYLKRSAYHDAHDTTDGYNGGPAPIAIISMVTEDRERRAELLAIVALSAELALSAPVHNRRAA